MQDIPPEVRCKRETLCELDCNGPFHDQFCDFIGFRIRMDPQPKGCVWHFDPPAEHKTYLHRSGRTARAGGKGLVVTLVLWNEELEVRRMQRRVGLDLPIVEMFSNDERLQDLTAWDPKA